MERDRAPGIKQARTAIERKGNQSRHSADRSRKPHWAWMGGGRIQNGRSEEEERGRRGNDGPF